jgi:hypothetical protein
MRTTNELKCWFCLRSVFFIVQILCFWSPRTRTGTSRIYDFICIVLVVVLVLDTKLRDFFSILC